MRISVFAGMTAGQDSRLTSAIQITIGLDYTHYEPNSNLIDLTLLSNRNTIAHGQQIRIEEEDFMVLFQKIIDMLRRIKDEIITAASCESYRIQTTVSI